MQHYQRKFGARAQALDQHIRQAGAPDGAAFAGWEWRADTMAGHRWARQQEQKKVLLCHALLDSRAEGFAWRWRGSPSLPSRRGSSPCWSSLLGLAQLLRPGAAASEAP
jgi:hypothetical protein